MKSETVQSLGAQAEKAYRKGRYAQAAGLFDDAARLAAAEGDPLKAAEMANNRSVALLQANDAQGALQAAQGTETIFAGAADTLRQAQALGNQAAALEALNRLEEALALYKQCNELLKQAGDQTYRPAVLKSISALQLRTGHQLEALASMDAALQNEKKPSLQERFLKKLLHIPFTMMKNK